MIRRYGEPPHADVRYRLRPGAYAILAVGQEVLVTYQSSPHPELQLPGGGIDPGEAPLAALHREVAEETGWSMHVERRLGAFRRFTYMPDYGFWAEKLCHVYLGRPGLRRGPPSEPGHSAVWVTPAVAARELGNAGDRGFVRRVFGL